ncbi:metalloregulator ArsR/SmtB family transcription factor [Altererythrobacter sp. ZODW24]|uniref:ArsR/SmtB family transcription factor n=1 Tax=Altererythrobacter sp. ZODW24 TaxID=2185142 RepID=UPI000DF8565E|nr:metalloregulator ArsR/SmtB family transcription factor [Altererythrobacter sp. ZODW24]
MNVTDATIDLADMTANSEAAAALMRALSSGPRLLIMCHLAAAGELPVGALVERVGLSQSALSQHLAKLREQELVEFRREAQSLYYRIADPKALRVLDLLHDIFCPELEKAPD